MFHSTAALNLGFQTNGSIAHFGKVFKMVNRWALNNIVLAQPPSWGEFKWKFLQIVYFYQCMYLRFQKCNCAFFFEVVGVGSYRLKLHRIKKESERMMLNIENEITFLKLEGTV